MIGMMAQETPTGWVLDSTVRAFIGEQVAADFYAPTSTEQVEVEGDLKDLFGERKWDTLGVTDVNIYHSVRDYHLYGGICLTLGVRMVEGEEPTIDEWDLFSERTHENYSLRSDELENIISSIKQYIEQ